MGKNICNLIFIIERRRRVIVQVFILTHSSSQRRFRSSGLQHYSCTALWALDSGPLQSLRSFRARGHCPVCDPVWAELWRWDSSWRLSDCKGMKPSLLHHRANRSWYDVFDFTHTCCTWWTKSPEALQTWSLLPCSFWRDVFSSKQATLVHSASNCSVMNFDL